MNQPLVSVIVTCFNHSRFIEKAIISIYNQNYSPLEIIIIDDNSTDESKNIIERLKKKDSSIITILNETNLGFCKSFNTAFKESKGDFIIDLAADDILLPNKIAKQVELFNTLTPDYGIVYSDLNFINEEDIQIPDTRKHIQFPEGNIRHLLIEKHLIYAATMMVKRDVHLELNGYNENYSFEDLDFFTRSTKNWKFAPIKEPLISKRELKTSLGKKTKSKNNQLTIDTLTILRRLKSEHLSKQEKSSLKKRFLYEAKEAFDNSNYSYAISFLKELII